MTIDDSTIVTVIGGLATLLIGAAGKAFLYLKGRADECEKDRAGLHSKLTTTLTYLAELCGKMGIDFDPEKTPEPGSGSHKAFQIFRKMESHLEDSK